MSIWVILYTFGCHSVSISSCHCVYMVQYNIDPCLFHSVILCPCPYYPKKCHAPRVHAFAFTHDWSCERYGRGCRVSLGTTDSQQLYWFEYWFDCWFKLQVYFNILVVVYNIVSIVTARSRGLVRWTLGHTVPPDRPKKYNYWYADGFHTKGWNVYIWYNVCDHRNLFLVKCNYKWIKITMSFLKKILIFFFLFRNGKLSVVGL